MGVSSPHAQHKPLLIKSGGIKISAAQTADALADNNKIIRRRFHIRKSETARRCYWRSTTVAPQVTRDVLIAWLFCLGPFRRGKREKTRGVVVLEWQRTLQRVHKLEQRG